MSNLQTSFGFITNNRFYRYLSEPITTTFTLYQYNYSKQSHTNLDEIMEHDEEGKDKSVKYCPICLKCIQYNKDIICYKMSELFPSLQMGPYDDEEEYFDICSNCPSETKFCFNHTKFF